MVNLQPSSRLALAIAAAALALRLVWVLAIVPNPTLNGGDGPYYLSVGRSLAGPGALGWQSMAAIGPVYPLYLSVFFRLLTDETAVIRAVRVSQAVLDALMILAVFGLGRRLFNARVGLTAAALLAVDLRFIVQVSEISTETLFIFLLVASSWAFVLARDSRAESNAGRAGLITAAGAAGLGLLAAFTRAIALPIPALLTGALLLPKPSRAQALGALGILGLMVGGLSVWTIRQHDLTGRWVLISEGLTGNFWMGSRSDGQWHGNAGFQKEINDLKARYNGQLAYLQDALQTIQADPPAYGQLLARKAASAFLQPYGTAAFPGDSLKDLAVKALRRQISLGELIGGDAFWPKLYIYVLHYTELTGGLIGLWLTRRDWLKLLPVTAPIVYLSITYTLLTIIPRYVFPTMPFFALLAAYSFNRLYEARPARGLKT